MNINVRRRICDTFSCRMSDGDQKGIEKATVTSVRFATDISKAVGKATVRKRRLSDVY